LFRTHLQGVLLAAASVALLAAAALFASGVIGSFLRGCQ
jgi:hypothetical protein